MQMATLEKITKYQCSECSEEHNERVDKCNACGIVFKKEPLCKWHLACNDQVFVDRIRCSSKYRCKNKQKENNENKSKI